MFLLRSHLRLLLNVLFVLVVVAFTAWSILRNRAPTHSPVSLLDYEEFLNSENALHQHLARSYLPSEALAAAPFDVKTNPLELRLQNQFDPRLLPALWLYYLTHRMQCSNGSFDESLSLRFSWRSFLGLSQQLSEDIEAQTFTVASVLERLPKCMVQLERRLSLKAQDDEPTPIWNSVIVKQPGDVVLPQSLRRFVGANYLYHSAPLPRKIGFLLPQAPTFFVPVDQDISQLPLQDKAELLRLAGGYIAYAESGEFSSILIAEQTAKLQYVLSKAPQSSFWGNKSTSVELDKYISMSRQEFQFDFRAFIEQEHLDPLDRQMAATIRANIPQMPNFSKYFHEAQSIGENHGDHYDWRFFKRLDYTDYERRALLHLLVRAWLRFANNAGLRTWLAHGTLLGWYWNGMSLPWDFDIDVQVTMESLVTLARDFNQTLIVDCSSLDLNQGVRSYLVDIAPNFFSRSVGNGKNIIDARFIDTSTGLYIDITALSFTADSQKFGFNGTSKETELARMLDPNGINLAQSYLIDLQGVGGTLRGLRDEFIKNRTIFNCRNDHYYSLHELSPLVSSYFEGVEAYVPLGYHRILAREYPKGLISKFHENHMFRPFLGLWVPFNVCKNDRYGNLCFDKQTLLEARYTRYVTKTHMLQNIAEFLRTKAGKSANRDEYEKATEQLKLSSFRMDPWILRRSKQIRGLIAVE